MRRTHLPGPISAPSSLRVPAGLRLLAPLTLLLAPRLAPAVGVDERDFDVDTVSTYNVSAASAYGSSNGVGWAICSTHFSSCCGANTNGSYQGFNTTNFSPLVANSDDLHITQSDFTVLFEEPIESLVVYLRENGGSASLDLGLSFTTISGAGNLSISGTRVTPNTSGGALRYDDLSTYSVDHTSAIFDGLNMAFYVEALDEAAGALTGDGSTLCTDAATDADEDGYSALEDCDDADAAVHPDAAEICDDRDNDCDGDTDDDDSGLDTATATAWYADGDADGYGAGSPVIACDAPEGTVADDGDCDDADGAVLPGATEICNDLDDDCDGDMDDSDSGLDPSTASTWYADVDGDGQGDPSSPSLACDAPVGTLADASDCDDTDADVYLGATEVCNGYDDDCDALVDDADADVDPGTALTWYGDGDGDGYGDATDPRLACDQPEGAVANGGDCDDDDGALHPDANEVCDEIDNDCDTLVDDADGGLDRGSASTWYTDADGDGEGGAGTAALSCDASAGQVSDGSDCDDANAAVNHGAVEVCNGTDDDCDTSIDDADAGLDTGTATPWYLDVDGDGFGDPAAARLACEGLAGEVLDASDCDDAAAAVFPGASEVCNAIDDDCDTLVDDADADLAADTTSTWYADGDADGYGDAARPVSACEAPSGAVADRGDCDDAASAVHPGATEICDGLDDDCDGLLDDADGDLDPTTASAWYPDLDGDGFGEVTGEILACEAPPGAVADSSDCDDAAGAVYPGAAEICDGLDDDCDGLVDAEDPDFDATALGTWYADADGDGFGDDATAVQSCEAPEGHVAAGGDCDEADPAVLPGAPEVCNGLDDDCNGLTDDADDGVDLDTGSTWYTDADGDGYGDAASARAACDAPGGTVGDASDCADGDDAIHPAATEVCDGVDNDCDGLADDADDGVDASTLGTWYADADGDGFGDANLVSLACEPPAGTVADGSDCDDADGAAFPGAPELCTDVLDRNCDGSVGYADLDADGWAACEECDDAAAEVNPDAVETCNDRDDDCDGALDEEPADPSTWHADSDADGYGDPEVTVAECDAPEGYVGDDQDCDDADPGAFPGAEEVEDDGIDQDCDGADAVGDDSEPVGEDSDSSGDSDPVDDSDPVGEDSAGDDTAAPDSPPLDTGGKRDTGGKQDYEGGGGCGCDTGAGAAWIGGLGLVALAGRRRRR